MKALTQEQLVIGHWYSLIGHSEFELVARDECEHCIEVQFYDGTVAEFEISAAMLRGMSRCASPVNMAGALDGIADSEKAPFEKDGKWHDSLLEQLDSEALSTGITALGICGGLDDWNKDWR